MSDDIRYFCICGKQISYNERIYISIPSKKGYLNMHIKCFIDMKNRDIIKEVLK